MAALGRGATTDTTIKPDEVVFDAETDRLLRLLRTSGTDECLPKFVNEIKSGLSYRQFLTVLFLAAIENVCAAIPESATGLRIFDRW